MLLMQEVMLRDLEIPIEPYVQSHAVLPCAFAFALAPHYVEQIWPHEKPRDVQAFSSGRMGSP